MNVIVIIMSHGALVNILTTYSNESWYTYEYPYDYVTMSGIDNESDDVMHNESEPVESWRK